MKTAKKSLGLITGLLIGRGKKKSNFMGFLGIKSQKIGQFRGNFRGKLGRKAVGKKTADFVVIFRLEIAQFCAYQTSIFNVFLTEVIISSFNNNTLQK